MQENAAVIASTFSHLRAEHTVTFMHILEQLDDFDSSITVALRLSCVDGLLPDTSACV